MRYTTSVIIYNLQAIGGLALSIRKFLRLHGYLGFDRDFILLIAC